MDTPEIAPVYKQMDKCTRDFLGNIAAMLREQFSAEMSSVYLNKMIEHLETFYEDVVSELEDKKTKCESDIEELKEEAKNLREALNVDFKISSNDNNALPLSDYLKQLDSELVQMRELYKKRRDEIENCIDEQQLLCEALNEPLRHLSLNPLPTELEVASFEEYLIDLKSEKLKRENEIDCLKQEIGSMCDELDIPLSESVDKNFSPTMANLNSLRDELKSLRHQRDLIKRDCEHMLYTLESLWDCLEVASPMRSKYRNLASIYKQSSLEEIEDELKRCKAMKQENIKLFVDKLRIQIVAAWDKIHRSENERNRFTYFQSEVYTEDLLELHEMELEECKKYYENNRVIFEKFAERNAWWEKMIALEAKQNEPGRYNNRGGQLLREEKERKQLNLKLPEIEAEIKKLVDEYRDRTNRDFLINGEYIIDIMERDWESMRNAKEQLKSARKGNGATASKPWSAVPTTPKTPMSVRGQTTLKRMPSSTNLALVSGNTGKKMHLEVRSRNNNITSSSTSKKTNVTNGFTVRSQTKRNLFSQINSPNHFIRPTSAVKQMRAKTVRKMATLRVPTLSLPRRRSNGISNISASRIVKKYRRSTRISHITTTDESLINYDTFENHMKVSQFTNSSVVEPQENRNRIQNNLKKTPTSMHTRPILKTPNRNATTMLNHTRSPALSASAKKLRTKDLGFIIEFAAEYNAHMNQLIISVISQIEILVLNTHHLSIIPYFCFN